MTKVFPFRVRLLTFIVVLSNVLGNFLLSLGMKAQVLTTLGTYAKVMFSPMVVLGVSLLILWMLTRMTLMSWADLSYILPITSVGYILNAIIGRFVLDESISTMRWAGTLLITAGMLVVATTRPKTELAKIGKQS